jgi:hypothetical protein
MPETVQLPTIGRIVNYVMAVGVIRPMMIVRVMDADNGVINGQIFRDGAGDDRYDARGLANLKWVSGVRYDASKVPGSWHWPERL